MLIKSLLTIKKKKSGRNHSGTISIRHRGGEHKRFLRSIDWKRRKFGVEAKVSAIEYDPNRSADIALLSYKDGLRTYILAPIGLKVGDIIISSDDAAIKEGNSLPLKKIPVGVPIHALEITPGKGAQLVKSAGASAYLQSLEGAQAVVTLPSGEKRIFSAEARATIGQVGNAHLGAVKLTKAGQKRHRGIRPTVRGVAQHPNSHPHGGGEGRSSIGMHPKTPWGKSAFRRTRKKHKASNRLIVKRRKN